MRMKQIGVIDEYINLVIVFLKQILFYHSYFVLLQKFLTCFIYVWLLRLLVWTVQSKRNFAIQINESWIRPKYFVYLTFIISVVNWLLKQHKHYVLINHNNSRSGEFLVHSTHNNVVTTTLDQKKWKTYHNLALNLSFAFKFPVELKSQVGEKGKSWRRREGEAVEWMCTGGAAR